MYTYRMVHAKSSAATITFGNNYLNRSLMNAFAITLQTLFPLMLYSSAKNSIAYNNVLPRSNSMMVRHSKS